MSAGPAAALVKAFSTDPAAGNGAAVVLLERPAAAAWMQALARSFNQSETAFLLPGSGGWILRWFTPGCEVRLCGHATLAALLALQHWQRLGSDEAVIFHTLSGPLQGDVKQGMGPPMGRIQLPCGLLQPATAPPYLIQLLCEELHSAPIAFWCHADSYSVALLPGEAPLPAMASPAGRLQHPESRGLVLMQACDAGLQPLLLAGEAVDYQLRFFAPALGINEDPVTGSAHALVAPYWQHRLGRGRVIGWQCSPDPGGMVCEAGCSGMMRLSGAGVLLWSGRLQIQPEAGDDAWDGHCQEACSQWQALQPAG